MTDKEGKEVHSNWKCLYGSLGHETDIEELIQDPILEQVNKNWEQIRNEYMDYVLNTHGLDVQSRSQALDEIKVLFLANLEESLENFENDTLNTTSAYHVTNSKSQFQSPIWKKERYIRITASKFKDFISSPQVL